MLLVILITFFFIIPVIMLLMVQSKNFFGGKTTMERFGKGSDQDREARIVNSGITHDIQVYRESASRVGSYPNRHDSFNESAQNRLIPQRRTSSLLRSRRSLDSHSALHDRNVRLTNQAQTQSLCWAMCTQRELRSQYDIFKENNLFYDN